MSKYCSYFNSHIISVKKNHFRPSSFPPMLYIRLVKLSYYNTSWVMDILEPIISKLRHRHKQIQCILNAVLFSQTFSCSLTGFIYFSFVSGSLRDPGFITMNDYSKMSGRYQDVSTKFLFVSGNCVCEP